MLARSVLEVTQTHIHMRVCGVAVWSLVVRVLDLGIPGEAPRDHASASQRAPGEKDSRSGHGSLDDAETDDA